MMICLFYDFGVSTARRALVYASLRSHTTQISHFSDATEEDEDKAGRTERNFLLCICFYDIFILKPFSSLLEHKK